MTEKLPLLSSQFVTPSQTTALSSKANSIVVDHVISKVDTVDEEPYTIKCVCGVADDDGNTIYCETCDTWQHIQCYYPDNTDEAYREDFAHSCIDCKPRPVDVQRASDHQQRRKSTINIEEVSARKVKRLPSKAAKKKTKPMDLQLNGYSGSDSNSKTPSDHQQHKRSKSTHRTNQSVASQSAKRSPSYSQKNGLTHGHPPSPATTPPGMSADSDLYNYSDAFMSLYNGDRDIPIVQTNSFASLTISNAMSLWLRDHEKLRQDAGCEYDEVFQKLPPNIDLLKRQPDVAYQKLPIGPDKILKRPYLTTPQAIEKDVPLVELNGQIGFQKDYCSDPENRWDLSAPLPFVFFHPDLPLYIDTRKEGSIARYVRRSCRPNAVLDTYLSAGSEYHFWLVSDRRIAPNEQITVAWDFRLPKPQRARWLQHLGLEEASGSQPEYDPNETEYYQNISQWAYSILSEYGGCACDLGPECAFARFSRKYVAKSQSRSTSNKKKSRKTKTHAISPTSTGHATNSRAPSEGQGDDGENDSSSARSKPPSRDMTPARQGSLDTSGILTEPTDRDKRKIAAYEAKFSLIDQAQPPRKKKRTSDGPAAPNSSRHKSKTSMSHSKSERRYVDVGTNRSMSDSPHSAVSPKAASASKHSVSRHGSTAIPSRRSSAGSRPEYRDASVQTDPVENEWFSPVRQTPQTKRRVISLSKRLLESRHRTRVCEEERRRLSVASASASPTAVTSAMMRVALGSPSDRITQPTSPNLDGDTVSGDRVDRTGDTVMTDAPSGSPIGVRPPPPLIIPATGGSMKTKTPDLKVAMPPAPSFTPAANHTPLLTTATMVQSPFAPPNLPSPFSHATANGLGVAVNPSPVKKKLSLSDYKSRMSKAAAKPAGSALKTPTAIAETHKSAITTEVVMTDSPATEKLKES